MNKIQMVDLHGQYQKIKLQIDQSIRSVIDESAFINGEAVRSFAGQLEQFLGVKHVIPCGNGTDALQIALMALQLPKRSKVICPAFNYVATAETVALLDLIPVFVDVEPDSFCISLSELEKVMDPEVKAIMPVHLFGQGADMDKLVQLAKKYDCKIIEDAAQSIGCNYYTTGKAGTIGDLGITSFFPSKNLGGFGDGGAIFTNDSQLAERCRMIASHGQKEKYQFEVVGVNSRLDSIQAAVLSVKLAYLEEYNRLRNELAAFYDQELRHLQGIHLPFRVKYSDHVFHQYTLVVEDGKRDELKRFLEGKGIPSMIYYPKPLHLHNAYAYLGYKEGDFPVSEKLCEKVLSLPMHTEMDEEQRYFITSSVIEFFNG